MIKENRPHRLYADENFPQRAVQELRALGHDVLTLREDGKAGRGYPDDRVLRDAATSGRVLLTHDRRDFGRLHERGEIPHRGIVLCTQDRDHKRLAANIHTALSSKRTMDGEVVNVYRPVKE